jgi:glutamate-5-semialdehyde dehydrogenase
MSIYEEIEQMGDNARIAAQHLIKLTTEEKNKILHNMADALRIHRQAIKDANNIDITHAKEKHLPDALLDRLILTDARIDSSIDGILKVAALEDPIGKVLDEYISPAGLSIRKIQVPIGVIGVIYESRPNVTVDVAALCLKTANAVILKGGSESIHSNQAILKALQEGYSKDALLPSNAVQLITETNREAVKALVQMDKKVDLIIPRGGEGLINFVVEHARVPVIKHYKGVCHIYVDKDADVKQSLDIIENAKCQRPGVCNALETLLVHQDIAHTFLPQVAKRLLNRQVHLKGDARVCAILQEDAVPANEADWYAEYLDLIVSIKIVDDIDQAISHINHYGSHHSDAILSSNAHAQEQFGREIDSAAVYINASTRFTDGVEFGLGAEIGISTDKIHARGPMGLKELATYKYLITGSGQSRK